MLPLELQQEERDTLKIPKKISGKNRFIYFIGLIKGDSVL
jgi:hypothetical protein